MHKEPYYEHYPKIKELSFEEFIKFSHRSDLDKIAKSIGISKPLLIQSMYIFKQPQIGGEVICHQDSTFLNTQPAF